MIEVIKDKIRWNQELALIENIDVYHTYDYHDITKKPNETPILIKYKDQDNILLLPLLIRPIDDSNYNDAISVYGYSGILTLNLNEHFKKENFHQELNAFFNENKIVTVFSRFHPFLEHQVTLLEGLGTIITRGKVVYIDLNDSLEERRKMYNKRMKTYLNKSRRTCSIIESKEESDLNTFIDLYHENMNRVGADESYFFEKSYFKRLMDSDEFKTKLILCIHKDTHDVIAGALFMEKKGIVQYHLSGLKDQHSDLNAIKLIIDEIATQSSQEGFNYLNLGGGRGSDEDSLFQFKLSFSKHLKEFKIWKYVVDEDVYRTLVEKHLESSLETINQKTNFFPAYRADNFLKC